MLHFLKKIDNPLKLGGRAHLTAKPAFYSHVFVSTQVQMQVETRLTL